MASPDLLTHAQVKPVNNLRIQLIDGCYHTVDSTARSYQVAAVNKHGAKLIV